MLEEPWEERDRQRQRERERKGEILQPSNSNPFSHLDFF